MTKHLLFTFTLFLFFCFPFYTNGQITGPSFSCDAGFYQYFGNTDEITVFNPESELFEALGTTQPENYNAFGYNTEDDYLYGINQNTENLYGIDSNGDATLLGAVSGLGAFNAGDFDNNGNFFLQSGAAGPTDILYIVDVSASTPIASTTLALSMDIDNLADIVFDPVSGLFYGVSSALVLYSINPTTGVVTSVPVTGTGASTGFGGAFADRDGKLYFFKNNNGHIYEVNPTTGLATLTYSSSPSGSNDAASCPLACAPITGVVPTATFCNTINTPYTFTVDDSGVTINNPKYLWTGPNGFTSTDLAPNFTAVNTSASGEYCIVTYADDDNDDILDPTECASDPVCITLNFSNDDDGDLVGDFCDLDSDNDGILNIDETCGTYTLDMSTFINANNQNIIESIQGVPSGGIGSTVDIFGDIRNGASNNISLKATSNAEVVFTFNQPVKIRVSGQDNSVTGQFNYMDGNATLTTDIDAGFVINNPKIVGQSARFGLYDDGDGNPDNSREFNLISQTSTSLVIDAIPQFQVLKANSEWYIETTNYINTFTWTKPNGDLQPFQIEIICVQYDTDNDNTPDYLDTNSDNDGCPDAVEGEGGLTETDLESVTSTSPLETTINGVDANGVPNLATGGQGAGTNAYDGSVLDADCIAPLPVELLYFKGAIASNGSLLEWLTTTEINNDYFSVQHSFDGVEFDEIGIVHGNGNISSEMKYDFLDPKPKGGMNYYRLEQFDFDGTSEYSHTIALKYGSTNNFDVYPNPIRNLLNIHFDSSVNGKLEIRIIDVLGRVVHEMEINSIIGNNNIQLPVSNFVEGVYQLVLKEKSNNQTSVKKFLKIDK